MRDYEAIAAKFWNLPSKGEEESRRETLFMDDIIQKAHLDREIEALLPGVQTVLDAGGGAGRFSIPLAKRGLKVTHLDVSASMLAKAKETAEAEGVLENLTFVQARLTDIARYPDAHFDLVLSFDAPVSYVYPKQDDVLRELVRVSRKAVVVSVVSRLGASHYWFNPTYKRQYIIDPDSTDPLMKWYPALTPELLDKWYPDFEDYRRFRETGLLEDPQSVQAEMERGKTPWPVTYCFRPQELKTVLEEAGLQGVRLAGPGALARSIPQPVLKKLLFTPSLRQEFLDACYEYDSDPHVCGMGTDTLVASGVKPA